MAEDFIANNVGNTGGAAFSIGGLLSKTAETALEIARTKAEGGRAFGTALPTGQANPERLASDNDALPANSAANAAAFASKALPWIVGGGIIVAIALAALALRRR